jgi:hypothetical protein
MGLFRDRKDRPGLLGGRERRSDRRDDRGDRGDRGDRREDRRDDRGDRREDRHERRRGPGLLPDRDCSGRSGPARLKDPCRSWR